MNTNQSRKRRWRRLLMYAAVIPTGAFAVVILLHWVIPVRGVEPTIEAVTLCFPFIGPVTDFGVSRGAEAAAVRVHERVHQQQCRALGAVRQFMRGVTNRGRLLRESEAFCAQAEYEIARGANAYLVRERILDDIEFGYMGMRTVGRDGIRSEFARVCSSVNRSADSLAPSRRLHRPAAEL